MAERTPLKDLLLPDYRGQMLLLKYLELRQDYPPNIESLPEDFVEFVDPVNPSLNPPRPPERALRYLEDLVEDQYARVVELPGTGRVAELTPLGVLSAQGIGLHYKLKMQWEKQQERIVRNRARTNDPNL